MTREVNLISLIFLMLKAAYPAILFYLSLTLLCLLPIASVQAADHELKSDSSADKLDAILVLDASASMLETDPERLRDQGAKLLIQFLKPGDRLGVIQFSKDAELIRKLSPYDEAQFQSATETVTKIQNEGLYTNILSGVKVALEEFEDNKRDNANRIIILLSDGKMDPETSDGTAKELTEKLLNDYIPELKAKEIKIYSVALSQQADQDLLKSLAVGTDGISWYAPDASKIHQAYAELLLAVKKPQGLPLSSKGFRVDGDIQEATFYINREADQELEIQSPSGLRISAKIDSQGVKWFHGDKFDVVTIIKPESGDWQMVGLSSEDNFATILTNIKLVTDWPPPGLSAETPVLLQARLYEGEKPISLPEMSGVMRFSYQITPTDKISAPIIKDFLHDDGKAPDKTAQDGIFSGVVVFDHAGEYKLRLIAQSPTFQRQQQIPFRVRAPLISLEVETRELEAYVRKTPEAQAKETGAGEKDQAKEPAETTEGAEHVQHAEHAEQEPTHSSDKDFFVVTLSDEAMQLKNMKVKLTATDSKHIRYELPLVSHTDKQFECSAINLPKEDEFEIDAVLTAESRQRKEVRVHSKELKYKKTKFNAEDHAIEVKILKKEEPGEAFPWLELVLIISTNLLASYAAFNSFKKSQAETAGATPNFSSLDKIVKALEKLQAKSQLVEVDLNQAMFTDENFVASLPKLRAMTGRSHATEPHAVGETALAQPDEPTSDQKVAEEETAVTSDSYTAEPEAQADSEAMPEAQEEADPDKEQPAE